MPRPDISALGINYRRIPICSIGRDVYLDTRLILQKLETLPGVERPRLGAETGEHRAIERLLEIMSVDGGPFPWAATLLPADLPIWQDKAWTDDRASFFPGGKLAAPRPDARAEAVANLRGVFELLETSLLADGRNWLLGGDAPRLADIEAVWLLHWLRGIPGALPREHLSERQFPKVFAWIERFDRAVSAAAAAAAAAGSGGGAQAPEVSGEEAARTIVGSPYFDDDDTAARVVGDDPTVTALGLKQGDRVVVFPSDYGATHKDAGSLVGLDWKEVVFETKTTVQGSPTVRVHAPRHGFRVVREEQGSRL